MLLKLSLGAFFLMLTSGCIRAKEFSELKADSSPTPLASCPAMFNDPKVQVALQSQHLSELSKLKNLDFAWGLYSSGGWVDQGQILISSTKNNTVSRYKGRYMEPGSKEVKSVNLEDAKIATVKNSIDSLVSQTYNYCRKDSPVFDANRYEFVLYGQKNGSLSIEKRIFMVAPYIEPISQNHLDIISLIQSLVRPKANSSSENSDP